ncbi:myopalladin isoform X1 [Electrophorus electricus]|uniref:myopalladin isoform X1 n=1 Tax=Electrophorus electricus TaxID=8005 RepID=UPI0015CFB146|nr:myopalladin isoform X1 [Electrophorus electricus]XP_035387307.1 myopalladin isoform X1 [Electrophorus electricus]
MQEHDVAHPTSLPLLLQESYLVDANYRHSEFGCGTQREKVEEYGTQEEHQFPDLSAFLSQEELDKSVDLARKSIGNEQDERIDGCPQIISYSATIIKPTLERMDEGEMLQAPILDNKLGSIGNPREPPADFKRTIRNTPYGLETQSKKEFLNKAADFIEELSSLFKANNSKRVRPRACRTQRSRNQIKHQAETAPFIHYPENRERSIHHNEPLKNHAQNNQVKEVPYNTMQEESECMMECEVPAMMEPESSEPVYEPPHFIQKLKSREVAEGSKVHLDCIVRGFPVPEVRWFCEGKELENSPDIQIINNGELHSLSISEAFEEDTGRYSCFASNFCGTDSTSAEIYIEGASSSDSDTEQHFEAQLHKRVPQCSLTIPPVAYTAPLNTEDSKSDLTSSLNQPVPFDTPSTLFNDLASSTISIEVDINPAQVNSSQITVKEPSTAPSQMISSTCTAQLVNTSTPAHGQEISNLLSTTQHNFTENQNCNSYPQGLDGRPIMAAPVFTKSLQDVLALEGQLVVLECHVKGVPSPRVNWYREGSLIEDSPDFRILQKKERFTLVIAEVFPEDSGTFTCTASNKYGTVSSIAVLKVKGNDNRNYTKALSTSAVDLSYHSVLESVLLTETKYPLTSCLKSKSERVLENNTESRSSSRVGLRVTFKLPEDDEKKSISQEGMLSNKEPPPVLAKPKLNPLQLQTLHNQILLEQQQESAPLCQEFSQSDRASREPECKKENLLPPLNPVPSALMQTSAPLINTFSVAKMNTSPLSLLSTTPALSPNNNAPASHGDSIPLKENNPVILHDNHPISQQNMSLNSQLNTLSINPIPFTEIPKMILHPRALMSSFNMVSFKPEPPTVAPTVAPISSISNLNATCTTSLSQLTTPRISVTQPNVGPSTSLSPFGLTTKAQLNPCPTAKINMTSTIPSTPISQMNMALTTWMRSKPIMHVDMAVSTKNSLNKSGIIPETIQNITPLNKLSLEPALVQKDNYQIANSVTLNCTTPLHSFKNAPLPFLSTMSASSIQTPPVYITPISSANSLQSENYTRSKELTVASNLSPVRIPSPTVSPVPIFHELATQLFPRPTMDFTSPINHVEPPVVSSHPHVSSIPLALVNPACAVQPQSSSQASSNSSSPSPIQNSVAFLSSVLPALPTCPPTNAMGLPMRAPPGSQVTLRKDHRGSHPMSYDIHNSRETLSNDTQKMFQFKNELPYYGQKEYKISNFEQRLMNEIEFHLERTPVEESDDEIQHDEIPTGKCIAPLFDQKLKNFRVMEGVPVTFTCKVVGIPIPKVYWFKDGKQIFKKNEHFKRIRSGDGTCSLHIEAATNDDDGNYTVMAANPQGRMSSTGHLIVQSGIVRSRPMVHSQRVRTRVKQVEGEPSEEHFFHPHFLQAPGDMVSHEGRICRLDYKVSGLPYPEMIWLLNGKPVYPDLNHRMLVRENGIHSLVIDPLTKGDAGTYTCIASNKAGQSSFFLELSVVEKETKQAPMFVEKLQNRGIAEGLPVRLECRIVGMPTPVIYWKKDNDTISNSKERYSLHQDTTGYVCLLIQPSRKEDAGWYTVSAKNEAGVLSCTARLDIYAQWHQQIHSPIRNASFTGNHYSPPTGEGPDIKPVFPKSENHLMIFSTSQEECTPQSEEL